MKKHNWTTESGSKVELETNETINSVFVSSIKVNGNKIAVANFNNSETEIECKVGDKIGIVILPENVREELFAGINAKREKANKELQEYYKGKEEVEKAMGY